MTTEDNNSDERKARLERMRALLKPISHERAHELLHRRTEEMEANVEQTARKRHDGLEEEPAPDSSK